MTGAALFGGGSFERYMEHVPAAFAIARGAVHTLVYANAAFRRLAVPAGELAMGGPISDAFRGRDTSGLIALLDRVIRTGVAERDRRIGAVDGGTSAWFCSVWPGMSGQGEPAHLVIELRLATQTEITLALQRDVAERMLLSALREHDIAEGAEASSRRATFLAAEGRRLAGSLDEETTLDAIARLSLPQLGAWCIVDMLDSDGAMHRLAIVHLDPTKQVLAHELAGRWTPELGDPFGVPAMLRAAGPVMIAEDIDGALAAAAHDPATLHVLLDLGVGPLLTVPLVIHERLVGAVTFVGGSRDRPYTKEDVELAEDLAVRSAMALDRARLHGEAVALKTKAESASQAKTLFLGAMSHELRTPLNAIGGYVDLIDMGLRGPVTEAQRSDLARIRSNQQHLIGLVTDLLNFVQVGSGQALYTLADVAMHEALAAGVALVEPLLLQNELVLDGVSCDATIVARADRQKVVQIIGNLLSNAIKFTLPGGRIEMRCEAREDTVLLRVTDTGIGIPPDQLAAIFEPFFQVRSGLAGRDSGVGLGLAISRDLGRAMGGDLTVVSEPGVGSTFTLSLPSAAPRG